VAEELLYHYTSGEGFIGIINSGKLWATDALYLNDARELQFGRDELYEALLASANEFDPGDAEPLSDEQDQSLARATVLRSAADELRKASGPFLSGTYADYAVYVSCFCYGEADLLSQWRGYGSAGGFALGFNAGKLAGTTFPDESARVSLAGVNYGEAAIADIIDWALTVAMPQVPLGFPGANGAVVGGRLLLTALAALKDVGFAEEREWRLIVPANPKSDLVRFRSGTITPTPHIELEFDPRALREVVVGPGPHQELRMASASRLVGSHGMLWVKVVPSKLPFRG